MYFSVVNNSLKTHTNNLSVGMYARTTEIKSLWKDLLRARVYFSFTGRAARRANSGIGSRLLYVCVIIFSKNLIESWSRQQMGRRIVGP